MRDTHTHTTPHAHAGPARASGDRGRRARRTLAPRRQSSSRVEGGDQDLGPAPPLPECASVGARRPAFSRGWRGFFCLRRPLGSG